MRTSINMLVCVEQVYLPEDIDIYHGRKITESLEKAIRFQFEA